MRVQLVFRTGQGDLYEMRDSSSSDFEGHHLSEPLKDGEVFERKGLLWLASREESDGLVRFVCTPVED